MLVSGKGPKPWPISVVGPVNREMAAIIDQPRAQKLKRRRIRSIAVLVGLGVVVGYVLTFGWSFRGFPDPDPWIVVSNNGPSAVTVQLWEGGPVYRSDCGTKQGFGEVGRFPPLPPWHTRLRSASTGRLLGEAWAWGVNGWMKAYVQPDGTVQIGHVRDLHGSGPAPQCSKAIQA